MNRIIKFILIVIITLTLINCSEKSDEEKAAEHLSDAIDKAKVSEFTGFYFVGIYSRIPSLYWFDYKKNKSKVFWYDPQERVIDLIISPDNKSGYFITKRKQRLKSSQPAIEKGRLYRIDFEKRKAELITQLVDGIQIIPYWIDNDRFTLVINSVDLTIASYINKNIQVYNRFGKLLSDNTEVFDIAKDGYPITSLPALQFNSPNGLFRVLEKNDSIIVSQSESNKEIKTRFKTKVLLQIKWAEDNKHVLLLMKDRNEPLASNYPILAIFDLQKKKTIKIFNDINVQYFRLKGNYLLIDSGSGNKSFIQLTQLDSLEKIIDIKINGGCSLKRI